MELLYLIGGLVVGMYVAFYFYTKSQRIQSENKTLTVDKEALHAAYEVLNERIQKAETEYKALQNKERELTIANATLKTKLSDIPNLAQNIMHKLSEQGVKKLSEENLKNIEKLLIPLREGIKRFEGHHVDTLKGHAALAQHIKLLGELTEKSQNHTRELTEALRGQSKMQGDWGEMMLVRLLELSGWQQGREFHLQRSYDHEDKKVRPDVVVQLPEDRKLVIDSKLTLNPYLKFLESESNTPSPEHRKQFLNAIKAHIRSLQSKDYSQVVQSGGVDYVVMFIPIEPVFLLALKEDPALVQSALAHKIVLVCPSTLMSVLGIVNMMWSQAKQQKNAQEIADRGKQLYEKFVGFTKNMQSVKKRLNHAQEGFDDAYKQLHTGRGNLVSQAQQLITLGIKSNKELPEEFKQDAPSESLSSMSAPSTKDTLFEEITDETPAAENSREE